MWVHVLCNALNRVLMVHKEKKHLYFVNESFVDSNVFTSNVADADYDKVTARPYDWVLVGDKLEYRPFVDKELTAIQALVNLVDHKRWIYFEILNRINLARARYEELNILQLETYRVKYEQAVFLQKNDYDISAYNNAPMVVDYAELDNCSVKQAAEQIILKHQLYIDMLTKTEFFRMKFLRKLKELNDVESIKGLLNEIHRDTFLNILL